MKMKFLIFAMLIGLQLNLHANEKGNGGGVHYCPEREKKAEMYDIYEGRTVYNLEFKIDEKQTSDEIIKKALKKLAWFNYVFAKEVEATILTFKNIINIKEKIKLDLVPDANILVVDEDCSYEQLANWNVSGHILVKKKYYDQLDNFNLAAFYLHEAIYKVRSDRFDEQNSDKTRRLVAELLSTKVLISNPPMGATSNSYYNKSFFEPGSYYGNSYARDIASFDYYFAIATDGFKSQFISIDQKSNDKVVFSPYGLSMNYRIGIGDTSTIDFDADGIADIQFKVEEWDKNSLRDYKDRSKYLRFSCGPTIDEEHHIHDKMYELADINKPLNLKSSLLNCYFEIGDDNLKKINLTTTVTLHNDKKTKYSVTDSIILHKHGGNFLKYGLKSSMNINFIQLSPYDLVKRN